MKIFLIESKLSNAKNWLPVSDRLFYSIKTANLEMKKMEAEFSQSQMKRVFQVAKYIKEKNSL